MAAAIERELPSLTGEILATIGREVGEYSRPLEGSFGRGIRIGVSEALRQFVALIRDPDSGRSGREVYIELGRGEFRQGRTLDSLQSAYRVGARVAWRRIAGAAGGAGAETLTQLAESIFAYIDELSADSVEGYTEAASRAEGERQRRRHQLARLVLREPAAAETELLRAARAANWSLPASLAALACLPEDLDRMAGRLPEGLVTSLDGFGCILVPDPSGPGRADALERATSGATAALGPSGPRVRAVFSWALARLGLAAVDAGAIATSGLVRADDHLSELLLVQGQEIVSYLADLRLAPFRTLTAKARERMELTARAYLAERGNATAMARVLHVHPQTARYRITRLRELIGPILDDPERRFELDLALRMGHLRPEVR